MRRIALPVCGNETHTVYKISVKTIVYSTRGGSRDDLGEVLMT